MAYPWSVYKTWVTGEILTAADLNSNNSTIVSNSIPTSIDDYSSNVASMQSVADPYPASSESLASALSGELERLRYVIAQITGKTYWYYDPDLSLANLYSGTTTLSGVKTFANAVTFTSAATFNTAPILSTTTASTALVVDASKNVISSAVTVTELGYVSGVTSALQTQINAKAPSASPTFTGTIGTPLTSTRVVRTDGSGNLATGQVNLASANEVTGTLPTGNGGTGFSNKLFTTGTYTGNGGTQSIAHGLGATPSLVIISVTSTGNNVGHMFITGMTNSHDLSGTNQVNGITSVDGTNINIGANAAVNQNAVGYAFVAFKAQ